LKKLESALGAEGSCIKTAWVFSRAGSPGNPDGMDLLEQALDKFAQAEAVWAGLFT